MDFEPKARSVMIVDGDLGFQHALKNDAQALTAPPIFANNGKEAQAILGNVNTAISGVFVNLKTGHSVVADVGPSALSVIRFCKQSRPRTPIYVIYDPGEQPTDEDLKSLNVRGALQKPVSYAKMLELVAPHAVMFDSKSPIAGKGSTDTLQGELTATDSEFFPIRAEDFVAGSQSAFHVYVRLGANKYVKILHAGESFSPDRLSVYLKKGVTSFYLRKENQHQYLSYTSRIASKVVSHQNISVDVKVSQSLNHGQETLSFLRAQGLSESNLLHATSFVENVQKVTAQMNFGENSFMQDFMSNIAGYEHGVSTAMVTAMLGQASGVKSESLVQIVGIASMLHDIGLYQLPADLRTEDESKMTKEQKEIFQTHPRLGAEMLEKVPGTHPSVIQAVFQHHERRGKTGFAMQSRIKNINRVAEIIGIADEYLHLIERTKADQSINIHRELEENIFSGFSPPIVEAFKKVFGM